jgi:putative ABC transport system substrate-binding protein
MRRRNFIALLAGAAASATAHAEERRVRIGILWQSTPALMAVNETLEGFSQGLADKGYIEGRNVVFEERYAEGHPDRLPALVADLLSVGVDVVFAAGTPQALAAKHKTTTVPIVFISADPVGAGLVDSLAHPDGNLTGISVLSGEYSSKWLELLKEVEPQKIRRVAALWNPDNPAVAKQVEQLRRAAPGLGIELSVFPARANEIEASLAAISSAGVDGLVLTDDGYLTTLGDRLATFASEHRIPTLAGFRVREGILMSYSVDSRTVGRRAADYVGRILKGARPADLPVEQIREFALRINLKTAKSLDLTIPFSLVAGADEVIE